MIKDVENARWRDVIAAALNLDVQDLSLKLLAAGVNNSVYYVSLTNPYSNQSLTDSRELILRVPATGKSLMSYGAIGNAQIKNRFATFAKSGYSPQLVDVDLPDGGILCEYIAGRPAKSPDDLSLITGSLAALHTSDNACVSSNRHPQATKQNTISHATMLKVIAERMKLLDDVNFSDGGRGMGINKASCKLIRQLTENCMRAPITNIDAYEQNSSTLMLPILKDANPSNFIIADSSADIITDINADLNADLNASSSKVANAERAMVVDIEGDFYGLPIIDVGHSSLFSASMWAYEGITPLAATDILGLYEEYYHRLNERLNDRSDDRLNERSDERLNERSDERLNERSDERLNDRSDERSDDRLPELHGSKLAKHTMPPSDIILSIRYATLGRCLGWMLMLIYLAEVKGVATPQDKLERARLILSPEKLHLAMDSEQEISKLL
ncbi:MAG: hypothetical protein HAW61_01355 [Candidatus Portiera sp.]|nr:hypothetical protein [Portiera sp.]